MNYAPGKTEVILHIIGPGSKARKAALHDQHNAVLDNGWPYICSACGSLLQAFGHLVQQGAAASKEVGHRGTVARQSWGPLHRPFYSKSDVSIRTKMAVFRTLTLSRLVVLNAHIWSPCPPAQIQKWQNAIRKPLGLLAKGHTSGVSPLLLDAPVLCGILRILPPEDLLHMARLRYLKRLFAVCPMVLWQLLMVIAGVRCR